MRAEIDGAAALQPVFDGNNDTMTTHPDAGRLARNFFRKWNLVETWNFRLGMVRDTHLFSVNAQRMAGHIK